VCREIGHLQWDDRPNPTIRRPGATCSSVAMLGLCHRVAIALHLREQLEAVAARDHEAEAAAGSREVALSDVLDGNPRVPDALSENIEIALGGDLEAGENPSRGIRQTQNDAVTTEFVPFLPDPAFRSASMASDRDSLVARRAWGRQETRGQPIAYYATADRKPI
jgi:hypothetical protein